MARVAQHTPFHIVGERRATAALVKEAGSAQRLALRRRIRSVDVGVLLRPFVHAVAPLVLRQQDVLRSENIR